MPSRLDIAGHRFGRLLVVCLNGRSTKNKILWLCLCDCGSEYSATVANLRCGRTHSCGCLRNEMLSKRATTHGASKTREYAIYRGIIARCENRNVRGYPRWGGAGIAICEEWRRSFESFLAHVGPRPSPRHSIDRINNLGNYEPGNVRWVTVDVQNNNRKNTRYVTYRGEVIPLRKAVRLAGDVIHYEAAAIRIFRCGWDVARAVETPRLHLSGNSKERRKSINIQAKRVA